MFGAAGLHSLAIFAITCGLVFQQAHGQNVPPEQGAMGVHAIIARGQPATAETGFDLLNVMVSLPNLIVQQIPGSTSLGLPYQYGVHDNFVAVHDGALLLQNYVTSYVASCPKSKIVVVGYSLVSCKPLLYLKAFSTDQNQGACLTMDAFCGTSSHDWLHSSDGT